MRTGRRCTYLPSMHSKKPGYWLAKANRAFDLLKRLMGNLFQRIKVLRRVATRYDKRHERFLGFVYIAGIMKWLH